MLKDDFIEFVNLCINRDLPFALYRLPNSDEVLLLISLCDAERCSFDELKLKGKGFVLHPFKRSSECPIWFLSEGFVISSKDEDISKDAERYVKDFDLKARKPKSSFFESDISKSQYLSKIESVIDRINRGDLRKLVFSKTKTIDSFEKKNLSSLFFKMEDQYDNAFVFLVNISGEFSWCGATPELLLGSIGQKFNTVALAGTQKYNGDNIEDYRWGKKDVEEQAFVCQHIEEKILQACLVFKKSVPKTVQAGGVVHIKTDYTIEGEKEKFWDIAEMLHPTPAVCGTPKSLALQMIEEVEDYNRAYYSGFMGPIDILSVKSLFVNLRCAKWSNNRLCLYVGGGITGQSIPEKEWEETEMKADTLIKLL